jgi:alanine racemase
MPENKHHRCWVEIHLDAFERNLKRIQASLPPGVRYIAVVKADAYGHGMPQIVRRIMQCGVDYFAVANTREAAVIREMGAGWPILILGPVLPEEAPDLIRDDLTATISDLDEARRLNELARSSNAILKVHLKIDTGMGRLGIWHEQAPELFKALKTMPALCLKGIYTHFSSADSDPDFTETQRQCFLNVLKKIKLPADCIIHADNSAGLDSFTANRHFNAVRVGLLQFGIPPYPNSALAGAEVEPVLHFKTRVGLIKTLPAGTGISYGHTYHLKKETTLAVLTAGYGDGLPYALGNCGKVLIKGQSCPILGRVTMDQTLVDVSALPDLKIGETATFIGSSGSGQISVSTFSAAANTIPWDALCSISKRVTRVYHAPREL